MLSSEQRRSALLERLFNIRAALASIRSHDESLTEGAQKLLGSAEDLLRATFGTFQQAWTNIESIKDAARREQQAIRLCSDYSDVLREFGRKLIPVLEGAEPQNVPFELEPTLYHSITQIAAKWHLEHPVLSSTYQYNYSISMYDFGQWYQQLSLSGGVPVQSDHAYVFFSLPRIEQDSVPLHAVMLGHELGHLRVWQSQILQQLPLSYPKELALETAEPATNAQDRRNYATMARSWASELAADAISVFTLGPASILALTELAGTLGRIDADSLTHPATDRRLAFMIDVMKEQGLFDRPEMAALFSAYEDIADSWNRDIGTALSHRRTVAHVVLAQMRQVRPRLIRACKNAIPPRERFKASHWAEVERAARQFAAGLPYGERRRGSQVSEASSTVILNAAWLVKARGLAGLRREVGVEGSGIGGDIKASRALNQLVLKSYEISNYRRQKR